MDSTAMMDNCDVCGFDTSSDMLKKCSGLICYKRICPSCSKKYWGLCPDCKTKEQLAELARR